MMTTKNGFLSCHAGGIVVAACAVIFMAFAVSDFYLINRASTIADQVRLQNEQALVQQEMQNQVTLHAMDQSQISHWNKAFEAVQGDVDQDFVQEEIADWLWRDFSIRLTIVADGQDRAKVAVYEETILDQSEGQPALDQNIDLIKKARQTYLDYLAAQTVPVTGFNGIHHPVRSASPIYVSDVRKINGKLSLAVAQVMVPEEDLPMPGADAHVLLTFKTISEAGIARLGNKFKLEKVSLSEGTTEDPAVASLKLASLPTGETIYVSWKKGAPSRAIWQQTSSILSLIYVAAGLVLALIAVRFRRMVVELKASEEQNRFLALHDALTGLPNRLFFDRSLEEIIAQGKQDRCAILCLDLDRFKAVNDTFGHQAGDVVLKTISDRICERVGDHGMVARVGGDEFIVLLYDNLEKYNVLFLCDQLIEEVCIPIDVPGGTASVGASIGVAWWPDDALTVKSIIRCADDALYRSKEKGRGTVSCASKMRRKVDQREETLSTSPVDQLRDEIARSA